MFQIDSTIYSAAVGTPTESAQTGSRTKEVDGEVLSGLLGRVSFKDRFAFEQLYQMVSPQLYGTALRIVRQEDWAQEALQDAFVEIWHNAGEFQTSRGTPMAWMVSLVRYRSLDRLRKSQRIKAREIDDSGSTLEDAANRVDERARYTYLEAIQGCLGKLSTEQREAILKIYIEGLSYQEVASHLGTPVGTVKSWVHRGLERIKRCYNDED